MEIQRMFLGAYCEHTDTYITAYIIQHSNAMFYTENNLTVNIVYAIDIVHHIQRNLEAEVWILFTNNRGTALHLDSLLQRNHALHFWPTERALLLDPVHELIQALDHARIWCAGSAQDLKDLEYLIGTKIQLACIV